MTYFEHMGRYKNGQPPTFTPAPKLYRVSFDQTNNVYLVPNDEYDDFVEWVAINWAGDEIQGGDELTEDFLERRDVSIFEV